MVYGHHDLEGDRDLENPGEDETPHQDEEPTWITEHRNILKKTADLTNNSKNATENPNGFRK